MRTYATACLFWGAVAGFLHFSPALYALFMLWFPAIRTWQMRHVLRAHATDEGTSFSRALVITACIGLGFAAALSLPTYIAGWFLANLVHFRISN